METKPLRASFALGDKEAGLDSAALVQDLKTKLGIVKKALLAERKKTQDLEARVGVLEVTVQEKDAKLQDLQQETAQLEYELFCERSRVGQMSSSPTSRTKTQLDFEQESSNQTLTEEFHALKQENLALDAKISSLEEENKDLATALESRNSHLVLVVREMESNIDCLKGDIATHESREKTLESEKEALKTEIQRLEERLRTLSISFAQSSDEIAAQQAAKKDLEQVIAHLNQSLIAHAENEGLLAESLMKLKRELLLATSELKFDVLKINKVINREAKVSFRCSESGEYVFEIDQKSSRKLYSVESISEVSTDLSNPRRFSLRLSNGDVKVFESAQAQKLVEAIRRFISRLPT